MYSHTLLLTYHHVLCRVWNYEKITKEGTPTLARTIPAVIPNSRQSAVRYVVSTEWWWHCDIPQVMVVCAHENMMLMAVGFKDGTVVTIRGNLTRDRLSTMKVVHSEDSPGYVTGTCLVRSTAICSNYPLPFRAGIPADWKYNNIDDIHKQWSVCQ